MSVNNRIKNAIAAGIKAKTISDKSGVSYFRISSVAKPEKYRGESRFDTYETERINQALDSIASALSN